MDERLEHFVDEAEVAPLVLELLLEIDEVAGHGVQPAGQEASDREREVGPRREKRQAVLRDEQPRALERSHRGHGWNAEQHRHLAEDRSGLIDDVDPEVALEDLDCALRKDEESAGSAFLEEDIPRLVDSLRQLLTVIERRSHAAGIAERAAGCTPPISC